MKTFRRRSLFALLAITAVLIYFVAAKQKQVIPAPPKAAVTKLSSAPEISLPGAVIISNSEAAAKERLQQHRRRSERAEDMSAEEKAQFEKEFAEKIKPEVVRFCNVYAGHTSFGPEDVTVGKLRSIVNLRSDCRAYDFVIDGTTFGIVDDAGKVCVDSLSAPAARDLMKFPANPTPPKEGSVSKEEIFRLIRADSGKDFPPNQFAITPTGRSSAMNGGVSVEVGEQINEPLAPLAKFAMVFGPDGNLVCYGRDDQPSK